jgi:hypothetical protein
MQVIITAVAVQVVTAINRQGLFHDYDSQWHRGLREWGSGGGSSLVRGSAQFANELNPYSD